MRSLILFTGIAFMLLNCNSPTPSFSTTDKEAILAILKFQEKSWNDGNIDEFMMGYQHSDSLQFIGKDGIKFGWQTTLDNYKKNYPDRAAMGKLRFDILRINPISGNAAYLTGKFFLSRSIGDLSGIFTLVLKKIEGQWLIVYDHTAG